MIIVNTEGIAGREIAETLGLVRGSTIRAKWFGKDIMAGIRNILGGELKEYTEMMTEAREQALRRMEDNAKKLGADAVVNVRFSTSMVIGGSAEMLAYGTAVKLK
ncbi:MAG: YbjQ family protein [Candidatus Altiarchaeota archaeon]